MLKTSILQLIFIIFILVTPPTLLILAIYDFKELKEKIKNLR